MWYTTREKKMQRQRQESRQSARIGRSQILRSCSGSALVTSRTDLACRPEHSGAEECAVSISWWSKWTTYLCYATLLAFGVIRDAAVSCVRPRRAGYAPLLQDIDDFFSRRMYRRISDCWNRPIAGPPLAGTVAVMLRSSCDGNATFEPTGDIVKCVNLGSYNYLGFAENTGPCAEQSIEAIRKYGITSCSSRTELGKISTPIFLIVCQSF